MKNNKWNLPLVAVVVAFATLLCLYSNKLEGANIATARLFSHAATEIEGVDTDSTKDMSDKDDIYSEGEDSKTPLRQKPHAPKIEREKPGITLPEPPELPEIPR